MYRAGKEIAIYGFIERKNVQNDPGRKCSKNFFVSRECQPLTTVARAFGHKNEGTAIPDPPSEGGESPL